MSKQPLIVLQGKTNRRVFIPMNETVKSLLKECLGRHEDELVFPSPKTGSKGTSVKKGVIGAYTRAKIPKITVRDLRRTAATRLLDRSANHITIATLLSHSDLRMVMRYTKASTAAHEAVKLLETSNRSKIVPEEKKALTAVSA